MLAGHLPKDVKVLVANGTTTAGAASRVVQPLTAAGYNVLAPTDATKAAKTATRSSVVYFTPGYDLDARFIATRLTLQPTAVQTLPATPPVANTQGANVIVVVGPDLAGSGSTTATTAHTARQPPPPRHLAGAHHGSPDDDHRQAGHHHDQSPSRDRVTQAAFSPDGGSSSRRAGRACR